jgi:hypothetical protein
VCHGAPCKIKGRNSNPLSNNQRKKQALRQARQSINTMGENERMVYIHEPGATNNRVASIKYHYDPHTRTLRYGATLYTAPSDAAQRDQQVYCTAVAETLTTLMEEGVDLSAFDGMVVQGCKVSIHKATVEESEEFLELDLPVYGMSLEDTHNQEEPTNGEDESDDAEDEDYEDSNAEDSNTDSAVDSEDAESECEDASECEGECNANADCNAECDEDAEEDATDEDFAEDPDLDAEDIDDDEDNLEDNQAEEADSDEDQSESFSNDDDDAESESLEVMSVTVANPLFPVEPFSKKQSRALAHHRYALSPIVLHNVGPWLLPMGGTDYKAMDAFVRKCMYEHGAYARRRSHPRHSPQQQDEQGENEHDGGRSNGYANDADREPRLQQPECEAVEDTGCPPV